MQTPDFQLIMKELADKRLTIEMDAWQAFLIVGQLQLALRHPANVGSASDEIRVVIDAICQMLNGCPETMKVVEMGWKEVHDVEVSDS